MINNRKAGAPASTEVVVSNHIRSTASALGQSEHPGMKHIRLVEHNFWTKGPAGWHECLVFKPATQNIGDSITPESPLKTLEVPGAAANDKSAWNLMRGNAETLPVVLGSLLQGLDLLYQVGVVHTGKYPFPSLSRLPQVRKRVPMHISFDNMTMMSKAYHKVN